MRTDISHTRLWQTEAIDGYEPELPETAVCARRARPTTGASGA
ncbi:hypothetical protein [Pseudomonas matsuisoli]|nr:hypothetical protein [Pseudomonas matsuisoli]